MTDAPFIIPVEEDERTKMLTGKKALQRLQRKTEFQEPHKNPWDQLVGEPMQWFARFELFRKLPPDQRSIARAHAEYQRQQKKDPTIQKVTPSTWTQTASRWRWKKRAEAWDAWQIEQDRVAFDEERRRERKKRIETLSAAREILSDEILDVLNNRERLGEIPFPMLLKAMALVMREQRTEFGEASSIMRTEVTGVGGGPIAQTVDIGVSEMAVGRLLENMSLDQLRALKSLRDMVLNDGDVVEGEIVIEPGELVAIEGGGGE